MRLPSFERSRAMGLLRRFFQTSLLLGRMPSLLGREIFRARADGPGARAFEDSVVFVCDVERCLRKLEPRDQRILAFCVFEDRSEWDAARRLHCGQSEISRRLGKTLDSLHETFCCMGLLERPPVPLTTPKGENHAQS